MPATGDQRLNLKTLVEHQRSGALGAAQLVRRQGHGIDSGRIVATKIHIDLANRLHDIGMKPGPRHPGLRSQFGDILQYTGFVVGEHHRDQPRLERQHGLIIFSVNPAHSINCKFM